jgi:hypothetical protein
MTIVHVGQDKNKKQLLCFTISLCYFVLRNSQLTKITFYNYIIVVVLMK